MQRLTVSERLLVIALAPALAVLWLRPALGVAVGDRSHRRVADRALDRAVFGTGAGTIATLAGGGRRSSVRSA